MQRDGVRCPGRSNKSSRLPSPSGPLSREDRPPSSSPANVLSGEWVTLAELHSNAFAISWNTVASSQSLFVAPCLGVFSTVSCLQERERVSFPSVQARFPGRLSLGLEASPKATPLLRKSVENGIFLDQNLADK